MREVVAIFFSALAVLAILTGPSLARTSDAPKPDSKPVQQACSAYQRLPDGSWGRAPCEEINSGVPAHQKTSTRSTGETSR